MSADAAHTLQLLRTGQLPAGTTHLRLQGLGLDDAAVQALWPALRPYRDHVQLLDLGHNPLTTLPDWLAQLPQLRVLFASFTRMRSLPPVLAQCHSLHTVGFRGCQLQQLQAQHLPAQLQALILTDNPLSALPDDLGVRCPQLRKLMLACNRLQQLPSSLAQCQQLELLRLSGNQLQHLPEVLLQLPALSWLALAGNPLTHRAETHALRTHTLPVWRWHALQVQHLLGEGASGHVWQAQHRASGHSVAVKVFKHAHTSDGLPQSEMAAGIAAGAHPQLLTPHACVQGHPEGGSAMALPLLPASWSALAQPPSLDSCTRDRYAPEAAWSAVTAHRLLQHVERAAAHLHQRGVLHGDLYAHNVLWDGHSGDACLSDLGAACVLHDLPTRTQEALLQMEQRALQHLRAEVQARVRIAAIHAATAP